MRGDKSNCRMEAGGGLLPHGSRLRTASPPVREGFLPEFPSVTSLIDSVSLMALLVRCPQYFQLCPPASRFPSGTGGRILPLALHTPSARNAPLLFNLLSLQNCNLSTHPCFIFSIVLVGHFLKFCLPSIPVSNVSYTKAEIFIHLLTTGNPVLK